MNSLSLISFLLTALSAGAFVPAQQHCAQRLQPGAAVANFVGIVGRNGFHYDHNKIVAAQSVRPPTSTSLQISFLTDIYQSVTELPADFDLSLGMFIIFCAVTPYFVGLFFPDFLFKKFFLPIYDDAKEKEGRAAEIYWKLLYATLGLSLTAISFNDAVLTEVTAKDALRDSYVAWALFYVVAIIKIRYEATVSKIIEADGRGPIQIWHSLVVIGLLVDVGLRSDVLDSVRQSLFS